MRHWILRGALMAFACAAQLPAQNLFARTMSPRTLVGDNPARFVGDILTIRDQEDYRIWDVGDRLPNGNLIVAGTRTVQVDDETKTLQLSGIVRRLDVRVDNTVFSSQGADARVAIVGEGANTRMTTRGPVAELFDTLIWAAWPF